MKCSHFMKFCFLLLLDNWKHAALYDTPYGLKVPHGCSFRSFSLGSSKFIRLTGLKLEGFYNYSLKVLRELRGYCIIEEPNSSTSYTKTDYETTSQDIPTTSTLPSSSKNNFCHSYLSINLFLVNDF